MLFRSQKATFVWKIQPPEGLVTGKVYMDGSQRNSEPKFAGCCSRRGWAFTAVNQGDVVAAAYGRPPAWITSIPGTETWAMLQATQCAMPGCQYRTDCDAVRIGCHKSQRAATASSQQLARVWAPIMANLEGTGAEAVAWMPAHTAAHQVGRARLSNGEALTLVDRHQNALADAMAKEAAAGDTVPLVLRKVLVEHAGRVGQVAEWVGRATLEANQHVQWQLQGDKLVQRKLRDADAKPARRAAATTDKPKPPPAPQPLALRGLPGCAKWADLLQRVKAKRASN